MPSPASQCTSLSLSSNELWSEGVKARDDTGKRTGYFSVR